MKWIFLVLFILLFSNFVNAETISYCMNDNTLVKITNTTYIVNNETISVTERENIYCIFGCKNNACVYSTTSSVIIAIIIVIVLLVLIKILLS